VRQRDPRHLPGSAGFTLLELLVVMCIVAVIASLAMAGFRHARSNSGEAIASAALRTITQAQFAFAQTCGDQRYSPTLSGLGVPAPSTGQAFLSPDLVGDPIVKSGYRFAMAGTPATDGRQTCNGLAPVVTYQVTADPTASGVSGSLFFGTNTDRVVYSDTSTFAGNMPETGPPGHGSEVKK
jgi:prepilin-type N-terminal cleavage/methylation domain-containing protein